MKILLPLISRQEFNEEFLDKALEGAREVILLLVIDVNAMAGQFGFATSEIMQGTKIMQKVKEIIGQKRKKCSEITEWGDTATKINNIATLNDVDKIVLMKQKGVWWNELEKRLKKECKKKLEVIEIKPPEEKEEAKEKKEVIEPVKKPLWKR
ncbi:MAG: hypothetical protein AB1467_02030 [Candidatus Diapherotrites archaeon]